MKYQKFKELEANQEKMSDSELMEEIAIKVSEHIKSDNSEDKESANNVLYKLSRGKEFVKELIGKVRSKCHEDEMLLSPNALILQKSSRGGGYHLGVDMNECSSRKSIHIGSGLYSFVKPQPKQKEKQEIEDDLNPGHKGPGK